MNHTGENLMLFDELFENGEEIFVMVQAEIKDSARPA
jgi:hypothetical protein